MLYVVADQLVVVMKFMNCVALTNTYKNTLFMSKWKWSEGIG